MQLMTIEENIDTQSEALIGDLDASLEYCVAIQVSTIAGESGFSNILKIQCEFVLFFFDSYYAIAVLLIFNIMFQLHQMYSSKFA